MDFTSQREVREHGILHVYKPACQYTVLLGRKMRRYPSDIPQQAVGL